MIQHIERERGQGGPLVYLAAGDVREAETVFGLLCRNTALPFRLAAFMAEDWNRDLSPWPAPPVFGKEGFGGGGAATLAWLRQSYLPIVEKTPGPARFIAGYSLGGLFSLWAFYESGLFQGAAGCSPSLWFPGWGNYAAKKSAPKGVLYLSLGEREPLTRNRVMQTVGDALRSQYDLAQRQGLRASLTWHPGGHFQDPELRTALGIQWMLEQQCNPSPDSEYD